MAGNSWSHRARPSRVNNFSRLVSPRLARTLARFPDISLSQHFTPPFVNYRITLPHAIISRVAPQGMPVRPQKLPEAKACVIHMLTQQIM